jgi:hypothetical protein
MTVQLQQTLPQLRATERVTLLDFIVQDHFPQLEEIIQELRTSKE